MARYAVPMFPVQEVNRAGRLLVAAQELHGGVAARAAELEVIENWRAAHAYPAQTFYMTVKRHAEKFKRADGVAQRIKRMPSIVDKLLREPEMKLSQMQDIAGVRAVVRDLDELVELRNSLQRASWSHEELAAKDYIGSPKASGYRSQHLRYKYFGQGEKAAYQNLKVEIQLRTQAQHQWATAVEAADAFTRQSIKQSRGDPAWKRFFALMGSVFAMREDCPLVPGTQESYSELAREVLQLNEEHHIANVFSGFTTLIPRIEGQKRGLSARYFLVTLDPVARKARVRAYLKEEAAVAQAEYSQAEQELGPNPLTQVVLVSASSINALKRVYPNYFLDTVEFNRVVDDVLIEARRQARYPNRVPTA